MVAALDQAPAHACVPVVAPHDAEYVGGDLFSKIGRKAFQIDLFRVSSERITGEPATAPWSRDRRISEYTLSLVSHEAAPLGFRFSPMQREVVVRGYHAEQQDLLPGRYPNARQSLSPFAIEHPGVNGSMLPLTPTTPENDNDCQAVFTMLRGAYVIVLRNEDEQLYSTGIEGDRGRTLSIDVVDGFGLRRAVESPTLILLSGLKDPFLARLRVAIRRAGRHPQSVWPWLN